VQDASWYGGEPVWVAAERAGLVTAAYYFVGTEAAVDGVPLTYWKSFDDSVPGPRRVEQVLDWLSLDEAQRPHLVTLYFEDVDRATHRHGPGSPEGKAAIERVDGYLGQLLDGIAALPIGDQVTLIIVSDHGQTPINETERFIIDTVCDLQGLTVVGHGAVTFIYVPESEPERAVAIRDAINESWRHGRAMLREEAPAAWHVTEEAGFAKVIVQADPGYTAYSTAEKAGHATRGDHGWAPDFEDMRGIFLARGPRLPAGLRIPPISVTDVYPLMMKILSLPIDGPIDGDPELLPALLEQ
jgi:predicted AlkP superfamily pyrophosphatase or phosphodiesterase